MKSEDILNNLNIETKQLINVLNEVGAYIFMKDLSGCYTYANKLVLDLFNTNLESIKGKDDSYFFNLELANEIIENDKQVFEGKTLEVVEKNIIKDTNEIKYYLTVKKPLYDDNKQIVGMFGISTDITERKELENKLEEQKIFLDTILDNVDAYIYMKDKNRKFRYVNSKVAALFKKPVDEIIGKYDRDVIPIEIADAFWESDSEVLRKKKKISTEEIFKDDEKGNIYYWSVKLPYTLDETPAVIGFSTDITVLKAKDEEIKNTDKILYQQSKVAAMGEMIENIAHQWRQPLSIISSISSTIKLKKEMNLYDKKTEDSEIIKDLEKINDTTDFLSGTIEYFMNYLRYDNLKKYDNLDELINDVIKLTKLELSSKNIKIITDIDLLDGTNIKNELVQVLINIINNSKDAFEDKSIKDKVILIKTFEDKNEIIIEVSDNAGGIDNNIIDRIFEPYFTTKYKNVGTGIALYISQKIVITKLKGQITVSNKKITYGDNEYLGACFKIKLNKNIH